MDVKLGREGILALLADSSFMKGVIRETASHRKLQGALAEGVAKELSARLAHSPDRERYLRDRALLWRSVERLMAGEISSEEVSRGVKTGLAEIQGLKKKLMQTNLRSRRMKKELREMEEHLLRAYRLAAVGELAAGVVHEINNPLGTVKGLIQLLAEEKNLNASQRRDLAVVEREIKHVQEINRKLQNFSRSNGLETGPVNVHALIDEIISLMAHQLTKGKVQFHRQYSPRVPTIVADEHHLKQVFVNLILNALQAMPRGGAITIKTQTEGKSVRVMVTDTGSGISRANMGKIFNPFFTTKKEGTGLGLAVTQNIIRGYGGTITVSSRVGKGTTFTVTLPVKLVSGGRAGHAKRQAQNTRRR